jgi:hypothetical protein
MKKIKVVIKRLLHVLSTHAMNRATSTVFWDLKKAGAILMPRQFSVTGKGVNPS